MSDGASIGGVRVAGVADAERLAQLLHDFNTEFDTPSPGLAVLAPRLRRLLAGEDTFAVVGGTPIVGFGLVTLRSNVWYDGPVALLDELYVVPGYRSGGVGTALLGLVEASCRDRGVELVEINVDEGDHDARRFYERLGYRATGSTGDEHAIYYERTLT